MKISFLIVIVLMLLNASCYPAITGKVIDNETQLPIQGAIVLAQWTKSHCFGDCHHTIYKMEETETDNNGLFALSGVFAQIVDPPNLVIYKKGYVAWRNDFIFPEYSKRNDYHIWKRNYTYKLDKFKDEYSVDHHESFMGTGILYFMTNTIPKFSNAHHEESIKASAERKNPRKTLVSFDFKGNIIDAKTGEPIEGAVVLALYDAGYNRDPSLVLEGVSNSDGIVGVVGKYPWPYRLPEILIYKNGYLPDSSWYGSLLNFKWDNGYTFRLYKCNECEKAVPRYSVYSSLRVWAQAAERLGKPMLMNLLRQDMNW